MRQVILFLILASFSFSLVSSASSDSCDLTVQLVNQDPYPAVQGEYVKLVFQVDGVSDPDCGAITFELVEKYPIIFDAGQEKKVSLTSGVFAKDYSSHLTVPYKVRVDPTALDGNNSIEVRFSKEGSNEFFESQEFELEVQDARAEFEVYVKDFNYLTNKINFEILNIADTDIQAVTAEIVKENSIIVKGTRSRIIGDLDSNEYTTAEFEVQPEQSEITLNLHYTDSAGFRRVSTEKVTFNPEDFANRKADEKAPSKAPWIIGIVVVLVIVYLVFRRKKKKN